MARNNEGPMTDEELEAASEEIQNRREEVRADLAEDLGGDSDDYRAGKRFEDDGADTDEAIPDGGE